MTYEGATLNHLMFARIVKEVYNYELSYGVILISDQIISTCMK